MKNLQILALIGALAFTSCMKMPEFDAAEAAYPTLTKEQIQQNVKEVFGTTFSPDQDWSSTTQMTVSITADADLDNIVKVQILTASPYFNNEARILAEAAATKGQTITLSFDAPNSANRLFAACISNKGTYYTKGFEVGEENISFNESARARTRGVATDYGFPNASNFVLPINKSYLSYNAIRSIRSAQGETKNQNIQLWNGKGWEKERFWRNNSSHKSSDSNYKIEYPGSDWYMQNYSIRRNLSEGISDEEKEELTDIFNTYLYWNDNSEENKRKNNLSFIRNSNMVSLYNNQVQSTGEPVIITPVQATSSEMQYSDLYYYYYNPAVVSGMTDEEQVQYIKNLPKFMAMSVYDVLLSKNGSSEFFKNYEYVLPYYGEPSDFQLEDLNNYSTDGKIYRIRNGLKYQGQDYFMVYDQGVNSRLNTKYEDNSQALPMQLWQIFKSQDNSSCYLYNVGASCFLYYSGKWETSWTAAEYIESSCNPYALVVDDDGTYHFKRPNSQQQLGSDLEPYKNFGIWSDKNTTTGTCDWYLEEYDGTRTFAAKTNLQKILSVYSAKSFIIPQGYKIGFVLCKKMTNADDSYNHYFYNTYNAVNNGVLYADGRLNNEINNYPNHFLGDKNKGIIQTNDPRAAVFSANKKTYVTFEDGADANYVDLIIEIGNGIEEEEEQDEQVYNGVYTFCFEDRQNGDYDMNDVVIKAQRIDQTHVKYSLEASGAHDELYLRGINGSVLNEATEIHALFGVDKTTFINTTGDQHFEPIQEIVEVPSDFTFTDVSQQLYIFNATTQKEIRLSEAGEDPHALLIPYDYQYPLETVCIKDANTSFIDWGTNPVSENSDWYKVGVTGKVYTQSILK